MVQRCFLPALCEHSPDAATRELARSILGGDAASLAYLWDRLLETGVACMQSLKVGESYLIRTVTQYYTGRVKSVSFTDVVLEEAAWIPDTGRYYLALQTGQLNEVEPYPEEVIISTAAIVDAARWNHPLPRTPK